MELFMNSCVCCGKIIDDDIAWFCSDKCDAEYTAYCDKQSEESESDPAYY